jgi:nucleoside-diphosphate-sugar epimerase
VSRAVLVTGATGLVGSYAVERFAAEGWKVRSLVRDAGPARFLSDLGSELRSGDVLDERAFLAAAQGCDLIVHSAALVTARAGWEQFRRLNIDGTLNAIGAAEHTGARLVQVSSVAVYGMRERYRSTPTGEDTPVAAIRPGNHYGRSKRESEQLVMQAHAAGRIWATAVRPDVVYGRRDRQFIPRFAALLSRGVFPLFGGGRNTLAVVHAANVADGIFRAATTDAAGGPAYNLANDFDVTARQFVELGAAGLRRRVRAIHVPVTVARAGVSLLSLALRWTRGESFAAQTRGSVDFLTRDNPFTSERARRELGWAPTIRPEAGVPEAFEWWRATRHGADAKRVGTAPTRFE